MFFFSLQKIPRSEIGDFGSNSKESSCNAGDQGSIPGWDNPLEKEMPTHSNILAQKIRWKEEPVGLQSTGSLRVGYD